MKATRSSSVTSRCRAGLLRAVLLAALLAASCHPPRSALRQAARVESACRHTLGVKSLATGELCEDVWHCDRPPGGRFDVIGVRRLAPCGGQTAALDPVHSGPVARPVVLYLPGGHMNGELALFEPRYELRIYLAFKGIPVWSLDYRTHAVPAQASRTELNDLAAWTGELFADDARFAIDMVRERDSGPLYLAGFSYGAGLAYRLAGRGDAGIAGLVILDGAATATRTPPDPATQDPAIDVGGRRLPYDLRRQLLDRVIDDPDGPSPLPGFPSAGQALTEVVYRASTFGGRGGLSNARGGASNIRVVARLLGSYDRWWPSTAVASTGSSSTGPIPTPLPNRLPVLAFSSTRIGPEWIERVRASARAFGGESAEIYELADHGHLDVLVGNAAEQQVFERVQAWLDEHSPRG